MIITSSKLTKAPVMSIQTGGVIAETKRALIDPGKLEIIAFEVTGPLISKQPSYIRLTDVREISGVGLIVDSSDEIITQGDVIKIDELEAIKLNLIGMKVQDERNKKIGKVVGFTVDMASLYIQQLAVKRPLPYSLNDTELLIHRTQIVEINDEAIVVHSLAKTPEPEKAEVPGSYVNPFRKPATDSAEASIDSGRA